MSKKIFQYMCIQLDEGAPLIAKGKDGKLSVIGIFAKSSATSDCVDRKVSVFMRTSSYDKWITKTTANKKQN
jgi:secreted trypsin-like serine protease